MASKKGFSLPEILVGVGVIVLIIVVVSGVLRRGGTSEAPVMEETSMEAEDEMMGEEETMADAPLTNTYTHPAGATLDYPDGWIIDDNSETPSVVYKDEAAQNRAGNGAGVLIITNVLPEGTDFEAYAAASGEAFAAQFGTEAEAIPLTINGVQAYMFDFTYTQDNTTLRANLYFFPGDGIAYALFATAETSLFDKYEGVLTNIVNSFQVQ